MVMREGYGYGWVFGIEDFLYEVCYTLVRICLGVHLTTCQCCQVGRPFGFVRVFRFALCAYVYGGHLYSSEVQEIAFG